MEGLKSALLLELEGYSARIVALEATVIRPVTPTVKQILDDDSAHLTNLEEQNSTVGSNSEMTGLHSENVPSATLIPIASDLRNIVEKEVQEQLEGRWEMLDKFFESQFENGDSYSTIGAGALTEYIAKLHYDQDTQQSRYYTLETSMNNIRRNFDSMIVEIHTAREEHEEQHRLDIETATKKHEEQRRLDIEIATKKHDDLVQTQNNVSPPQLDYIS